MFLSIDARGVVKQRDLNTFEILNSFYTHHYVDQNIFKEVTDFKRDAIFLEQKKFDVKREEVIASSASEENGDYLLISANYMSMYSVNNVLLALFSRAAKNDEMNALESRPRIGPFTCGLITNVLRNL